MDRMRLQGVRLLLIVSLSLLVAPTLAGCGGSAGGDGWTAAATPAHTPAMHDTSPDAMAQAAWSARPAYVRSQPRVEAAYAFAMARPDVLSWLPCYCGCVAMDHRSNLDCFYKPSQPGSELQFEEHASYCDVCVETALLAKQMLAEGQGLRAIRDQVDATFGGAAPGTVTPLPPA